MKKQYMEFLDEITGVDGYGSLLQEGDPIQFQVGYHEWLRENGHG